MIDNEFLKSLIAYRKEYHRSRVEFAAKQFLSGLFRHFKTKTTEKYPDVIIYFIGDQSYVNYNTKNKYFYYSYIKIYSVLKSEFGLNDQKINELIQEKVDEHLKLGVVTPFSHFIIFIL